MAPERLGEIFGEFAPKGAVNARDHLIETIQDFSDVDPPRDDLTFILAEVVE